MELADDKFPQEVQIRVIPEIAGVDEKLVEFVASSLKIFSNQIHHLEILSRSIDARQKQVFINLKILVYTQENHNSSNINLPFYPDVKHSEKILVIGAGPAGLFAALQLIESGLKPIIIERGKNVKERIASIRDINVHHIVSEDSNYCFGEGGAGAFSDGKLYTRSKKRGDVRRVLELLVGFGATKDILVDAHPHIGTNKLPEIIKNMRETILAAGGEIHFNSRVTDFIIKENQISGVVTKEGNMFHANKVILATGHSARDIFEILYNKGIEIELKPLAIGVRIEHPQTLIDSIQYHCENRGHYLPPSSYSIVKQINERGVYSFCMCPGGVIAPCATKQDEIVTNGWSSSRRAGEFANSGIVVELRPEDFKSFSHFGPLAAMEFQKDLEHKAWVAGGKTQTAPAQRLLDFIEGNISDDLPKTSYPPGIKSVNLRTILPDFIYLALKNGFLEFGKSMKGYLTNEAVVHAPETRTSSPVSIPRNPETLEHIRIKGLYPCGEGAGYAGGIVSAAIDGIKCAKACAGVVA